MLCDIRCVSRSMCNVHKLSQFVTETRHSAVFMSHHIGLLFQKSQNRERPDKPSCSLFSLLFAPAIPNKVIIHDNDEVNYTTTYNSNNFPRRLGVCQEQLASGRRCINFLVWRRRILANFQTNLHKLSMATT